MRDKRVKEEAMQVIGTFSVLPRLVVFDLDHTLWPFYCECRSKREMPSLYPHAKGILHALKEKGFDVAIASRSPTPDIATALSRKAELEINEIYSSWFHKTEHFQLIHSRTGVPSIALDVAGFKDGGDQYFGWQWREPWRIQERVREIRRKHRSYGKEQAEMAHEDFFPR